MPWALTRPYGHGMNTARPRLAAATLLASGGAIAAVGGTVIALARIATAAGATVRPADVLLVDDLTAVLPFVIAFAVADLAIARGVARGRAWAVASGSVLSLGAATMAVLGLALVLAGSSPSAFVIVSPGTAVLGGLIAGIAAIYLLALLALRSDGSLGVPSRMAAA
jgi:hypothetical protein